MTAMFIAEVVRVEASASRIWCALTTPEELIEWYAPGCRWEASSFAPGAQVRFFNTETDVQTAVVAHAVAPHHLALRWQVEAGDSSPSILNTFTLEADGTATTVTIRQGGYEALPAEQRAQWLEQDRGALAAIAATLKAYVERGATRSE